MLNSFKSELKELRKAYSMFAFRDCTEKENEKIKNLKADYGKVPDNVMVEDRNGETVYRCQTEKLDSTHEERVEYILLKQTEHLLSIRKMLLFFVVLTCIGLAAGLIAVLVMQSA